MIYNVLYNLGTPGERPLLPLPQWQVSIQSKSSPLVQTLPTFLAGTRPLRPMVTTTGRSAKTMGRRKPVTRSSLTSSGRLPPSKGKASSSLNLGKWYVFLFPYAHGDDRLIIDLKKDGFIELALNPQSVDDRKDAVSTLVLHLGATPLTIAPPSVVPNRPCNNVPPSSRFRPPNRVIKRSHRNALQYNSSPTHSVPRP